MTWVADPRTARPVCLYLNADADISFTSSATAPARLSRVAAGLTTHAIVGAGAEDAVVLRAEPEDAFAAHWESHGFPLPRLLDQGAAALPHPLEPLAWNVDAVCLAERGPPTEHPSVEVVRRSNHRRFLLAIEQATDGCEGALATTIGELEAGLATTLERHPQALVKGAFGSASTGNLRLGRPDLALPATRIRLAALLDRHSAAVVEPWCKRELDLCATGTVRRDGQVVTGRVDRTVHTDVGSPLGTLFADADPAVAPWRDAMLEGLEIVGRSLAEAGYFGPYCLDGLVHRVDGVPRLRRFVDLNARHPVSWPVRRFLARLDRPGVYLWRLFVPHRLGAAGVRRLGELLHEPRSFDADSARGLLGLAPLSVRIDGRWGTQPKLAVLIATDTIEQAFEREHTLRHQVDRRPPP